MLSYKESAQIWIVSLNVGEKAEDMKRTQKSLIRGCSKLLNCFSKGKRVFNSAG